MRILVANEGEAELDALTRAAEALGEVVAREVRVAEVARIAAEEEVELALVGLPSGESDDHALAMIAQLVEGDLCPVIAITSNNNDGFITKAAEMGIYAHTTRLDPGLLRGAVDVAMRRFQEHANLKVVMDRRALVERAKGILMERYALEERGAFEMLRREARATNLRLVDAAARILDSHRLLPGEARSTRRRARGTER
jgi:AmiR/NasT family two-component response regulator